MSGALQAVFMNQRSFGFPNGWPALIGDAYEGGYFAGQINQDGTIYNLVVSPRASGETTAIQWKTSDSATSGTDSDIDGPSNSAAMNNASHPAAQFCEGLSIGGYSDWYMPARMELEVCYFYLKPSTTLNNTSYGANAFAVSPEPVNTNYTSGNPAQTTAAIFQVSEGEDFSNSGTQAGDYWASTQSTTQTNRGWWERVKDGVTSTDTKTSLLRVRAIRRVAA